MKGRFLIEDTSGLVFLIPTIVLDIDKPNWMYKEICLVWFTRQLSWRW